ncbi:MAG: hypothetical protein WDO73_18965 [Ignavibacteriota bacterium]
MNAATVDLSRQLVFLMVLAIPIASIAWTVTHEEILREAREWCASRSKICRGVVQRKFFYLFTCEFCFSHYVTAAFLYITRFRLLFDDWRGYLVAGFSLVAVANLYMSLFGRLRGRNQARASRHSTGRSRMPAQSISDIRSISQLHL